MRFDQIRRALRNGEPVSLEVHALSASVYQLFLRTGDAILPMKRADGRAVVYKSRYAALQVLADLGLDRVDCVHRSAYGEMIGMAGSLAETELRESVPISHLRRSA